MAGLPSENFGGSVAGAGDVNGDGYADVIVGANGSDAAGLDVGRAYIFFGGVTVDNIPDVIITGTLITENLGNSVAGAGDVNNDGYGDVIVGAYANDLAGGNNSGKAYLYLGGSPMNNVVDVTFNGSAAFDYFGVCVAGAGDVNNDGYDDVFISSTENSNRGRTALFLGGAPMNNVADVTFFGEASTNNFGRAASAAGDLNQDGYADVVIGASANSQAGSFAGKTYVYYGGVSMDTNPDLTFLGEAAYDYFGVSVAGTGDVNGDGFGDVIVGATYGGATDKGRAYLYFSTDGPLPIQLASFTATLLEDHTVRLDWATLSELNNYGFEVQRKRASDPDFQTLPNSFIPGHGTTIEPHSYSYVDSGASPGLWTYRLKQMDLDGSLHYSEPVSVAVLTSVKENAVPIEFALERNYPNPFNPSTNIGFQISDYGLVTLRVYDVLGREVRTLVNERLQPGSYETTFDATGLPSGVYFCKLKTDGHISTKKMILTK
jgi:hypothetical protein